MAGRPGCGNTQTAEVSATPRRGNPQPGGASENLLPGRTANLLTPGHRTSPWVRATLGSPRPPHPRWPPSPLPESESVACASACAARSAGGGGRREQIRGKRRPAPRRSRVELVHPFSASSVTASWSGFAPPWVRPLPVAQSTAERVGGGYPRRLPPARRRSGLAAARRDIGFLFLPRSLFLPASRPA